uniref:Uncharacterized protein n=1 Tax=Candidatus Kentrum sp. DK TaxID=2126562 RepID=A0A450S773_9GAMM|nr:MAG: hypothetical protein BECKDK2373C_GA0170839_101915 [Candidatus Kentron sp. DK]
MVHSQESTELIAVSPLLFVFVAGAVATEQNAPAGCERRSRRLSFQMHHFGIRKLCFSDA